MSELRHLLSIPKIPRKYTDYICKSNVIIYPILYYNLNQINHTLILKDDSPVFFVAYNPGWAKWVSAEHTLSKRPIARGGAAVNTYN